MSVHLVHISVAFISKYIYIYIYIYACMYVLCMAIHFSRLVNVCMVITFIWWRGCPPHGNRKSFEHKSFGPMYIESQSTTVCTVCIAYVSAKLSLFLVHFLLAHLIEPLVADLIVQKPKCLICVFESLSGNNLKAPYVWQSTFEYYSSVFQCWIELQSQNNFIILTHTLSLSPFHDFEINFGKTNFLNYTP